jgi:REP element-mobilizing transposase RayT
MPDPKNPSTPDGWHSRGYLPHFDGGEVPQFITFRLADSMPQELLDRWREVLSKESDIDCDTALRKRIELYLDQGYGECHLRDLRIAGSVQNSLLFFDRERYRLSAWVIMPNHVHILITPCAGHKLSAILHSLKSYTANQANKLASRSGPFWQPESFDRYVRDADHFAKVISYIEHNPVKAHLCEKPEDWPFSSAWFQKKGVR